MDRPPEGVISSRRYSDWHRLRKYRRRKLRAVGDKVKLARLQELYWRYHPKVYGYHEPLWGKPETTGRRRNKP